MTRVAACRDGELAVGEKKVLEVAGESVLLARLEDGYYAVQNKCSHLFAPLGKGKIVENCQIECPFHKARFDLRSGEVARWACFPPGIQMLNFVRGEKCLKTFSVSVENGQVFVSA